jgi:hypothetical protein
MCVMPPGTRKRTFSRSGLRWPTKAPATTRANSDESAPRLVQASACAVESTWSSYRPAGKQAELVDVVGEPWGRGGDIDEAVLALSEQIDPARRGSSALKRATDYAASACQSPNAVARLSL